MPADGDTKRRRGVVLALLRSAGKPLTLKVQGRCMSPFLAPGDAVRIAFCEADELSIGDIVAYETGDGVAVHRVLRIAQIRGTMRVYQKGDNLKTGSWLDEDQVLGRVVSVIRPDSSETAVHTPSALMKAWCSARYFLIVLRSLARRLVRAFRKV
ncbi:MAG TPA: S24/S26 family peptidase [Acidobacteriota bacterium]|nr:S24/S26 family peptidase [Acidobacteriota bacterium]